MSAIIIVAHNAEYVIGDEQGKIPWHIPEEFKHFKKTTLNHACIMGRKTYESIPEPFRPLPSRLNIVITRQPKLDVPESVVVVHSLEDALVVAGERVPNKVPMILGGAQIYAEALEKKVVTKILASEVKGYDGIPAGAKFPNDKMGGSWHGEVLESHEKFDVWIWEKRSDVSIVPI